MQRATLNLFDLEKDPQEPVDLGDSDACKEIVADFHDKLFRWIRRQSQRTTRSEEQLIEIRTGSGRRGIVIGICDENDCPLELTAHYCGRKARNMTRSG